MARNASAPGNGFHAAAMPTKTILAPAYENALAIA
jgi:hypothetical protein